MAALPRRAKYSPMATTSQSTSSQHPLDESECVTSYSCGPLSRRPRGLVGFAGSHNLHVFAPVRPLVKVVNMPMTKSDKSKPNRHIASSKTHSKNWSLNLDRINRRIREKDKRHRINRISKAQCAVTSKLQLFPVTRQIRRGARFFRSQHIADHHRSRSIGKLAAFNLRLFEINMNNDELKVYYKFSLSRSRLLHYYSHNIPYKRIQILKKRQQKVCWTNAVRERNGPGFFHKPAPSDRGADMPNLLTPSSNSRFSTRSDICACRG